MTKRRITVGKVGDLMADQARKVADGLRAMTKVGRDPQGDKARERTAETVAELVVQFLDHHVGAKRQARTKAHYKDILKRIVLPKLGKMKAKDVTRADVSRLHVAWKHTPFQANRMLAVVGSMYSYASKQGIAPEGVNPARRIDKYKEEGRERYLSAHELERLGTAIREAETVGIEWNIGPDKQTKHAPKGERRRVIGEHAAAALRLLPFTGCRLCEILHLKWENVDLERGPLFLPTSKTGKKTVGLNAPALSVPAGLAGIGDYVIAGS